MTNDVEWLTQQAREGSAESREQAVNTLIALLEDEDPLVRSDAADALGPLGVREAGPALAAVLRADEEAVVRASAAESLGDLCDRSHVDALLLTAREDVDEAVRAYAAASLGLLQVPAERLVELQAVEASEWVRAELGFASYRVHGRTMMEALQPLTTDDPIFVERLLNGLGDLLDRGGSIPIDDASAVVRALDTVSSRLPELAPSLKSVRRRFEQIASPDDSVGTG